MASLTAHFELFDDLRTLLFKRLISREETLVAMTTPTIPRP